MAWLRVPWPLPALLAWAAAWLLYAALQRTTVPAVLALLLACALGTAASLLGKTWWRRGLIAAGFPLSLLATGASGMPAWAWLVPLALLLLVYPLNAWRDAPLFPTPQQALDALPGAAPLAPQSRVLDAGCGVGDGLVALRCPWARVQRGDMWGVDWGNYALVYLFQRPESMARAAAKASADMRAGAWLVSLEFPVPGVRPQAKLPLGAERVLWVYRLPLQTSAAPR